MAEKVSRSSIDADRRLIAKSRTCVTILGIEAYADGTPKRFDRVGYNDRQWHSLFVYCWQHRDDFEFEFKRDAKTGAKVLTSAEMAKLDLTVPDDQDIIMKHKVYVEDELKNTRINPLRKICLAKGVPDDGDKRAMIDAILEAQKIQEE